MAIGAFQRRPARLLVCASFALASMACGGRSGLLDGDDTSDAGVVAPDAPFDGGAFDAGAFDTGAFDAIEPDAGGLDAREDAPGSDAAQLDSDAATPPDACAAGCFDGPVVALAAPRQVAPLSTATVTSQTPVFRWVLANGEDGARVDICRDRACARPLVSFDATGTSGAPPSALDAGVYYWRLRATSGGAVGAATSAVWEFFVGARSAPVDTSWGATLDVNGDGFADVLVSGPSSYLGPPAVELFLGSAQGLTAQPSTLVGPPGALGYGASIASAGDVNGDGFGDLAIAAYDAAGTKDGEGVVYVTFGGPDGPTGAPVALVSPTPAPFARFGAELDGAGDVNGDGYADLVVSASGPDDMLTGPAAFVFFGGPAGPGSPAALTSGTVQGFLAGAGDVNGDGFGDVLVSSRSPNSSSPAPAFVSVFLGGDAGPSPAPIVLPAPVAGDWTFGRGLAGGADVNGDGYADIVVGDPGAQYEAYVYLGAAGSQPYGASPVPSAILPGVGAPLFIGAWLTSAGDANGDGYGDLAFGTGDASNTTSVIVYFGGPQPVMLSQPLGPPSPTLIVFGAQVAGVGDVNGDGFADLAIGAEDTSQRAAVIDVALGAAKNPLAPSSLVTLTSSFSSGSPQIAGAN